jgi:hypothetical protein
MTFVGLLRLVCCTAGCGIGLLSLGTTTYFAGPQSFTVTSTSFISKQPSPVTVSVTPLYMRCMQDCSGASRKLEVGSGTGILSRLRKVSLPDGVYWKGQDGRTDTLVLRGPSCPGITSLAGMRVYCSEMP